MELSRAMRWLLLCCGPMNLVGAVCFAPPFSAARRAWGLSEPVPFYLWILSAWIFGFGVAYFFQGYTGRANRGVLAIGAWGKGVFAGMLAGMSIAGELPPAAIAAAVPDLALAIVFAVYLLRSTKSAAQHNGNS